MEYAGNIGFNSVQNPSLYWLKVNRNNCSNADTILVSSLPVPNVNLGPDINACSTSVVLSANDTGQYLWSNKTNQFKVIVNKSGKYWLNVSWGNCNNSDTVFVNLYPIPQVNLGPDTNLCSNRVFLRTDERGNYLWNTMETTPSILIFQPGKYWLRISNGNCLATDTIDIVPCEDLLYFIPNSFTPNGDNINEVFRVYGSNFTHIEMEIYNRWGEKILETVGNDPFWDGTFKNEPCQESIYFYKIVIKGKNNGSIQYLKGTITLLR